MLETCLGTQLADEKRKEILKCHWNAGLLKRHGEGISKRAVADATAAAVFDAPYLVWKRSRWIKTTRPLRDIALLFNIGPGVAEEAIHRWLGRRDNAGNLLAIEDSSEAAAIPILDAEPAEVQEEKEPRKDEHKDETTKWAELNKEQKNEHFRLGPDAAGTTLIGTCPLSAACHCPHGQVVGRRQSGTKQGAHDKTTQGRRDRRLAAAQHSHSKTLD